jgi:TetR/AcrR family transcriptional regulator, fatty acid biosynthesis regulator
MTIVSRLEQKEQTRRRLIDAALALSAEHGFSSLSLREIARVSGIAPTGFYRHFRDLDELGLVMVDEVALTLRQLIREARSRFEEQGGRTRASVEAFMDYAHQKPHLFRLLLGERLGGSPAFRQAMRTEIDRFVAELSEEFEAQARAAKQPTTDIPLAAEAIVAIVFSVGAEVLELPRHRHAGLADRIIKEVHLVLRGVGLISPRRK